MCAVHCHVVLCCAAAQLVQLVSCGGQMGCTWELQHQLKQSNCISRQHCSTSLLAKLQVCGPASAGSANCCRCGVQQQWQPPVVLCSPVNSHDNICCSFWAWNSITCHWVVPAAPTLVHSVVQCRGGFPVGVVWQACKWGGVWDTDVYARNA
jgi:hypothetical protein